MEDMELQQLWKEYDRKIEESRILNLQSWVLQVQTFEYLQTEKAKSRLNALGRKKVALIVLGGVWTLFLAWLAVKGGLHQYYFFAGSLGVIALITAISTAIYIWQVVLIREIDQSESVTEVQEKTLQLKLTTLRVFRIAFLQTPFWGSWFLTMHMIESSWSRFWEIEVPIFALLSLISIWIYRNITYKNVGKPWMRFLLRSWEWKPMEKAMQFMGEIEAFKKERLS